jgi:peptidase, S41 family
MNQPSTKRTIAIDKTNLLIILVIVFVLGFSFGDRSHTIFNYVGKMFGCRINQTELDYKTLDQTYATLKQKFDGKIDLQTLIEGANKGLVGALGDRHTVYLTPKEAEQFNKNLEGDIGGGIGAEVGIRKELITIIRPLKDSPALKAGVQAGDVIYKVNDEEVGNQTLDQVIQKIRGKPGTEVKLTVARKNHSQPIDIKITRQTINNPSVNLEIKGDVAVLTVSRFDKQTAVLARQEAEKIKAQGISKVVLDLRGNSGGYLTAARDLAGLWLDGQLVVSERIGDKTVQEFFSKKGDNILANTKTVILMNAGSASASEIVIGALKDYKKATLVGETSFGKGSVQELVNLPNGGQLKVTVARWYTPQGQNIDGQGIKPDKEVELKADDWQNDRDPQLQTALEMLK